jgi:hypothetical protein
MHDVLRRRRNDIYLTDLNYASEYLVGYSLALTRAFGNSLRETVQLLSWWGG